MGYKKQRNYGSNVDKRKIHPNDLLVEGVKNMANYILSLTRLDVSPEKPRVIYDQAEASSLPVQLPDSL